MKLIETTGLSRSGHHAIINWIIYNLFGFQIQWNYKMTFVKPVELYILDEANHDKEVSLKYLDDYSNDIRFLITCYEDSNWDFTLYCEDEKYKGPLAYNTKKNYQVDLMGRFIIIRDFYDNLISRITSNEKKLGKYFNSSKDFYFDVDDGYIRKWKDLARACVENKSNFIKYEDWLNDDNKKSEFLTKTFNLSYARGIEHIVGTKSSFDDRKNKTGYDLNIIPENTKDLIKKDTELHYLIGALGYQYRNI